jgi:membrane protein implicated in regulation of membrane protease activity
MMSGDIISKLDAATAAENTALGFFTGASGAALSAGLSWLASSGLTPARQAIFAAVTLILTVFAAWFGAQWRLARAQRPALLRELRDRTRA